MNAPRMRFPAQALEELKQEDPQTPVTLKMIRRLVKTGAVPSVPVGNGRRRLLNYDALQAYLSAPATPTASEQVHGIRRINERAGA